MLKYTNKKKEKKDWDGTVYEIKYYEWVILYMK